MRSFELGGAVQPHDLPRLLMERNVGVAVVTRAPVDYTERVRSSLRD